MSVAFSPGPTLADTGDFESESKWLTGEADCVVVGAREYGFDFPTSSGVDGAGSVEYGFREQRLEFKAFYVAASANDVLGNFLTDTNAMAFVKSSLTYNGQTFPACFLDAGATRLGVIKSTGLPSALFFAEATIAVVNRRLA